MTDTKYVPLDDVLEAVAHLPGLPYNVLDDVLMPMASALRVAGPDDAIVPLDALRVARVCVASLQRISGRIPPGPPPAAESAYHDTLAALDAAIAAATPPEQTP